MNDRFKFRYWHTKENKYIYTQCDCLAIMNTVLYSLISKPNRGGWYETDIEKAYNNFELIPEQCTGLKDKNGNLIYENDRVGFYIYGQDEEWHAQQGTVIWYNSCWGIETSSRFIQFENELTIKNPKDIEIIGNVHTRSEE